MTVTLKDIAIRTGVNVGSISTVLNNHPKSLKLKAETRKRIREAARELGYHRNEMARAMVTRRTKVIAFVATEMGQISYTGKIQEGVFEEASERGYTVSFYHLVSDNHDEIIRKIREWKISGVIFHVGDSRLVAGMHQELSRLGIPFGTVNLSCEDQTGIGITTDDFQGTVDVMEHLSELGHSRIAHFTLTEDEDVEFLANRRNGYLEGMKQFVAETQPEIIKAGSKNCAEICEKLLSRPKSLRPSAVFCVMDTWAMELMRAAIKLGVKVPQELSIVGFGNLDMSEFAAVPLTTVAQPFREMGCLTASKIIEAIENPGIIKKPRGLKLKAELIVRESTAQLSSESSNSSV